MYNEGTTGCELQCFKEGVLYIFVLVNLKCTLITLLKFVLVLVVIDSFKYLIPKNFDIQLAM